MTLQTAKLFFIEKMKLNINQILQIKEVLNGCSNHVFLVTFNDNNYYLRIAKNNILINRLDEKLVLERLGIKYYYYNVNGDMIRDWYDAEHNLSWDNQKIISISNFMNKLHNISIKNISVFNHKQYEQYIIDTEYANLYHLYLELVDKYKHMDLCVCHNDLNSGNILYDGAKIIIIDYERVRLNTAYFDFANLAREDMNMDEIKFLCEYNKLDLNVFIEHLIITCIYALQWTLFFSDNILLGDYQENVLKRLKWFMQIIDIKMN